MKNILINIKGTDNNSITLPLEELSQTIIFGATGSGKSNFLHMMVTDLARSYSPKELQLALADPKHVEFNMYKSLPHLICPLSKTADEIHSLLKICIDRINNKNNTPIIIIIDELAELTFDKKIMSTLNEILNKGAKHNIFLIMATQRPDLIPEEIINKTKTQICFPIDSNKLPTKLLNELKRTTIKNHGEMIFVNGKTKTHMQTTYITQTIINDTINNLNK